MRLYRALILASISMMSVASCTVDFDEFNFGGTTTATTSGPATGGGSTTTTSDGGATAGSGGMGPGNGGAGPGGNGGAPPRCMNASDCGTATECVMYACDNGSCSESFAAAGTMCTVGGAFCDGNGACVECLMASDCVSGVCDNNMCAAPTCMDGVKNGDETDVDCGGSCAGCMNGQPCGVAGDCQSNQCVDMVCCDSACSGTCEACTALKTGGSDGTCAAVTTGTDPDMECADQGAPSCGADGTGCNGDNNNPSCNVYPAATECLAGTCQAGQQTSPSQCDGNGTCVPGANSDCVPYVCGPNACFTDCSMGKDADCSTGNHCTNNACVPDPPTCTEQYGMAPGYQFCLQNSNVCRFYAVNQNFSCGQICTFFGGECIDTFNNNGTCGLGNQLGCNHVGFNDVVCICSRGCGGSSECVGMMTCQNGNCQ